MTIKDCCISVLRQSVVGYVIGFITLLSLLLIDQRIKTFEPETPRVVTKAHANWHWWVSSIILWVWYASCIPFPRTKIFDASATRNLKNKLRADNLLDFKQLRANKMPICSFAVVRGTGDIHYSEILPLCRPNVAGLPEAFTVVFHVRSFGFLTGFATLCNPVSLEVCSGTPEYLQGAFMAHIVAFVALATLDHVLNREEARFEEFVAEALKPKPKQALGSARVIPVGPSQDADLKPLTSKSADKRRESSSSNVIIRDERAAQGGHVYRHKKPTSGGQTSARA